MFALVVYLCCYLVVVFVVAFKLYVLEFVVASVFDLAAAFVMSLVLLLTFPFVLALRVGCESPIVPKGT